jgi:MinD-like ATPase involved in chromosome partitioning or flagellar assembly
MVDCSHGEIITFYSYKGGVGRSMSLANVAVLLSHRGKRVLIIDFDLEGPGLHRYFKGTIASRPGIIEFFQDLRSSVVNGSENQRQVIEALLDRGDYVQTVTIDNPNELSGTRASLGLISSGRFDRAYPDRVRRFPWQQFYETYPSIVEDIADVLAERFDFILVDSRTGTTDIGNVCTVLLPEKLVLVSTPNEQSLHGATEVGRQAVELRKESSDLRPLPIFPLMSRIEHAEDDLRRHWIDVARQRFEDVFRSVYGLDRDLSLYFDKIQIPHRSFYAYGEIIAAERERVTETLSMAAAYQEFVHALLCHNVIEAQDAMRARMIQPTDAQQRTAMLEERVVAAERVERALREQLSRVQDTPAVSREQPHIDRMRREEAFYWRQTSLRVTPGLILVIGEVGFIAFSVAFYLTAVSEQDPLRVLSMLCVVGGAMWTIAVVLFVVNSRRVRSVLRDVRGERARYDESAGLYAAKAGGARLSLLIERTERLLTEAGSYSWRRYDRQSSIRGTGTRDS